MVTYKHMTDPSGNKIRVESAIRDGNGAKIDTTYQPKLVSGTNIKTINGQSILGNGDLEIASGYVLKVTVTVNNVATSGVSVTATSSGLPTLTATTGSDGTAKISGVIAGATYTLSGDGEDYNLSDSVTITSNVTEKVVTATKISLYWGIEIDETVSDCSDRVSYPAMLSTGSGTYTNCIPTNATPMSGADSLTVGSFASGNPAKLIAGIKPVSFDGTNWTDLDKTDESLWASTQGTDDFTEFPFRWLSITKSSSTITVVFSNADTAPDSTFKNYAFLGADGSTQRPNFHIGCYAVSGTVASKKITTGAFSQRGATIADNAMINQYWVAASRRGGEYDCFPGAMWIYLTALFLVLYKSTNSQVAHSYGSTATKKAGNLGFVYSNNYGMKGSTNETDAENAFFWIHNLWGNVYQYIASIFVRSNTNSLYYELGTMADSSKWDSGWNTSSKALLSNVGVDSGCTALIEKSQGYVSAIGNYEMGFMGDSSSAAGTVTTHYPDRMYRESQSGKYYATFLCVGGYAGMYTDQQGIFSVNFYFNSTTSTSAHASRLAYRGGHYYS